MLANGCSHELFGFDIMLASNLKPYLIEVNISPSMASSSPLDRDIKGRLLRDVFNIAGFVPPALRGAARPGDTLNEAVWRERGACCCCCSLLSPPPASPFHCACTHTQREKQTQTRTQHTHTLTCLLSAVARWGRHKVVFVAPDSKRAAKARVFCAAPRGAECCGKSRLDPRQSH